MVSAIAELPVCYVPWRNLAKSRQNREIVTELQLTDLRGSIGRLRSLQVRRCRFDSVWHAWRVSIAAQRQWCTAPNRRTVLWTSAESLCTPCLQFTTSYLVSWVSFLSRFRMRSKLYKSTSVYLMYRVKTAKHIALSRSKMRCVWQASALTIAH